MATETRQEREDISDVRVLRQRVIDLERWQTAQNGTLQRLEAKLDKLFLWMLGSLFTAVMALAGIVVTLLRG